MTNIASHSLKDGFEQSPNSKQKTMLLKRACRSLTFHLLSHLHPDLVRLSSIKTSALRSAPLINVSDGLAAGEVFSQLSVATINTYFMTNYIHNLTRRDGTGDKTACGAFRDLQRKNI